LGNLVRRLERLERELERARGLTSPLHWSAAGKI
jgi:hypothetical protein